MTLQIPTQFLDESVRHYTLAAAVLIIATLLCSNFSKTNTVPPTSLPSNTVPSTSQHFYQPSLPLFTTTPNIDHQNSQFNHAYVIVFSESLDKSIPQLYIYALQSGHAQISLQYTNVTVKLSNGFNSYSLSTNVFSVDGTGKKYITVKTNVSSTIYGFVRSRDACDGFLAIPKDKLGKRYIVPSYNVWTNRELSKSLIDIVAVYDDTNISITLNFQNSQLVYNNKEYRNGDTISLHLSAYETFQLSHVYDLSGSVITSTKPVGVVSGNKCNSITHGLCNPFAEMLLPLTQLHDMYIIPKLYHRDRCIIRALSVSPTQLKVINQLNVEIPTINNTFIDLNSTDMLLVNATEPIMVQMYPVESNGHDSYMMTIYGIHQYKTIYHFIVPEGFTSYITVTYHQGNSADLTSGFEVNGNHVTPLEKRTLNFANLVFHSVTFKASDGGNTMAHKDAIPFGLWVYGERSNDGYGFPADVAFNK